MPRGKHTYRCRGCGERRLLPVSGRADTRVEMGCQRCGGKTCWQALGMGLP